MSNFGTSKGTNNMRPVVIGSAIVAFIFTVFSLGSIFENLDAGSVMVIQAPLSGQLTWHTSPGVKWQGFGAVTKYQKRSEYWFSNKADQGANHDQSIKVRFNDGGHANISGGISWEMPLDDKKLNEIHTKFGSHLAVEQQLVRKAVEKGVYMTGPHMSSKESYAERRNELLNLVEDQIANGVYLTKTVQEKTKDQLTGEERTIAKVEMVTETKTGQAKRAEESPLKEFGIKVFNLSINAVVYDESVEKQIQQQQNLIMQVQTAIAESKKAEQELLTTSKQGEASAKKAEWEQKTIAAKQQAEAEMKQKIAETEAQTKLQVATLEAESAEMKKKAEIALGEGESKRRQLVMDADGALEKKLETWLAAQEAYAKALGMYHGNLAPQVQIGSQSGGSSVNDLISLIMAKSAKELALDLSPTKK
jgi:regulator of protease activity HflC (stomatin/prohibitin superfamily)